MSRLIWNREKWNWNKRKNYIANLLSILWLWRTRATHWRQTKKKNTPFNSTNIRINFFNFFCDSNKEIWNWVDKRVFFGKNSTQPNGYVRVSLLTGIRQCKKHRKCTKKTWKMCCCPLYIYMSVLCFVDYWYCVELFSRCRRKKNENEEEEDSTERMIFFVVLTSLGKQLSQR